MRLISAIVRAALSVLLAAVLLITVVGGCYWFSLTASLHGLEAGVRERDVVKLEKYIDWPTVREQVRSDLQAFVMMQVFKEAKTEKEGGLASSIGALLAGAVAPAMIDRVVDGFVTPQSLVRLLAEKPSTSAPNLTFTREGFTDLDEYTLLLGTSGPTHPQIRTILRREGITWRVVRVVFPFGEAPWETMGPRLQLGKIVPTRTAGSLAIEGDVTNSGNVASDMPPLRVALQDSAEKEVQFRIIDPPKPRLEPSETVRFKTTFDHPDDAATGVVVTFAPGGGVTTPDLIPQPSNVKPDTSVTDAPVTKQETEPSPMPKRPELKPERKPAPTRQAAEGEAGAPSSTYDPAQFEAFLKKMTVQPMAPDDAGNQQARIAPARPSSLPRASEVDLVREQIARCWNVPAGARDARDLVVKIRIGVDPDGTVRQATIVDQARLGSDPFFRAAAESARRAFFNPLCRPLHLPPDKYAIWRDLVVDFSPKDIL